MIRLICDACEKFKSGEYTEKSEHTCHIKDLPEIAIGTLMVYQYTKPVFFLFETYAPGSFCKCIPGTTSHFLQTGKETSTIFSHTVCRQASEGERAEYREIVKASKYADLAKELMEAL